MYDVIIIGAGVIGCAIARELSRYQIHACVLEKEEDVCCGTSKANSAIVHAGYDAIPGTLKAKMNVAGNERMDLVSKELDVPFRRIGSLVVCFYEEEYAQLEELYQRGISNGVKGLKMISREEVLTLEPNLSKKVIAALYAPTAGVICPFALTIAFAENAFTNGVEFIFSTKVEAIQKEKEIFILHTNRGDYESHCIINAAGVYADELHNMISKKKLNIIPRRGEYCLLDKAVGNYVNHIIFSPPSIYGKGVLVTPTVHGNILLGPTSFELEDKEDSSTSREGISEVLEKVMNTMMDVPTKQVITSFAGLRAHEEGNDFIISEAKDCCGFIDVAGIESPGLASAPAIGLMVANLVKEKYKLIENENYISTRKGILNPLQLSLVERKQLILQHPEYGNIICRCESISEGEILDAIQRPLGARSMDGVKRRVRAGMGRCQGGFCSSKVMEILKRETNHSMFDITKSGKLSQIVFRQTKGN